MMKTRFAMFMQRSLRRSQSGQSIVILALGFVALLGFVGIVTDVSLMFVRYSTLTRAVDAASIAAAGQVRRQIPFQSEINDHCTGVDSNGQAWTPSNPCPVAEAAAFARSFGNVGVAARQFIEFYGLDPSAVLIDMCFTVSTVDGDGNMVALNAEVADEFEELCVGSTGRNSDRKLIKVTAQIESPTVFLHLLGFQAILLEASSISETAVLDVVLIMDVSESMLNQTTPTTWAQQGYTDIYVPPDIWYNSYINGNTSNTANGFGTQRANNFGDLTGFHDYSPSTYLGTKWYHFRWDLSRLTPGQAQAQLCIGDADCRSRSSSSTKSPFEIKVLRHPAPYNQTPTAQPRTECRVGYFPYAFTGFPIPSSLNDLYKAAAPSLNGGQGWLTQGGGRDGYVPTYDFYRCCNDPNGDRDFSDLLCQPFRAARDATEQFLQRIDFLRGDRVAIVTFDREAFLVTVEVNEADDIWSHMIDNEALALDTLTESIGVRAEPSFYQPTVLPDGTQALPWDYTVANPWARSDQLGVHDYEVNNNCPFQDAALEFPYSPSSSPASGNPNGLPYDSFTYPNRLKPQAFDLLNPPIQRMYPRNGAYTWQTVTGYAANRSYDLWASCRGTNIGAALREGANALVDPRTTRTNGSVWVMVMLSDGAAGASDPVFNTSLPGGAGTLPGDLYYPYNDNTYRVTYGGLGLCPAGTPSQRSELTDFSETVGGSPRYIFPFCSDEQPETRHFCFDPNKTANVAGETIKLYVDLGQNCDADFYDVDDYARDWADWIGLSEPPGLSSSSQRNLTQLPTIFTIGFGLNFNGGVYGTTECKGTSGGNMDIRDVPDCLGEELLRYIADVGDNFRIDTDFQQALLENRAGIIGAMTNDDFGVRGECEDALPDGVGPATVGSINNLINPKQAGTSCGNYYNAPSGAELNRVFDDIASRMFTRLTQ